MRGRGGVSTEGGGHRERTGRRQHGGRYTVSGRGDVSTEDGAASARRAWDTVAEQREAAGRRVEEGRAAAVRSGRRLKPDRQRAPARSACQTRLIRHIGPT